MSEILILGEAWGREEEKEGRPFVGASGWLLDSLLSETGISRAECYVTNVFNLRPHGNDVKELCGPKTSGIPGTPALIKGKYVDVKYAPELRRLYDEINRENPNVIIALGATAAWALLGTTGIKTIRGATARSSSPALCGTRLARSYKVLPTYHPAAILRDWTLRPIVRADLNKAYRNRGSAEITRTEREIWIEPTLGDLLDFERYILASSRLSIDIETKGDQITCIGFATDPWRAIVIPFYCEGKADKNYWPTRAQEIQAWKIVKRWCKRPAVFQNGLYDMYRLWKTYGIACNSTDDTMLCHHAMQPEMEKGLGFLGSVYTDEIAWKPMGKSESNKKEA